ncbi:alpha/beta fold hydrolase [Terricaulis silvestris]|uniref:Haloacetate dehalogenase H-1 n=1 Tax=Terricaulis silvestris TaxID=2686094 RepID=A0A6I6MRK7_9CAUL|nr:alpha/beta hydrolase [Terricaulis silvestris]QGZ93773.1 Haloacetate dehalogenase H-1 [Terricaulis silvestris]
MSESELIPFATPDGLSLAGEIRGPADGALVALLHGGGQTRHAWTGVATQLATAGFRAMTYDARGHGDSAWSDQGDYELTTHARDLQAVLRTFGKPVAVVGASMGGVSGLLTAAEAPELLSALVLVDIVPRFSPQGVERIRTFMQSHPQGFATLDEVAAAVSAYNPGRTRPADPAGLMKNLRSGDDGRLRWHWDPAIMNAAPTHAVGDALTDALSRLPASLPTLLVRGAESDVVDADGLEEFRRHAPHAEVASIARAGHMVAGDRNDAFSGAVLPYLRRVLS